MFNRIQYTAAIGATIAGVGWVSAVSPPVAQAQPPHIPPGNNITCPDGGGVQYLPDPDNANGWYTCENGTQTQHNICPAAAKLIMSTPPQCQPESSHHGMP
jgi:hypothetical protein